MASAYQRHRTPEQRLASDQLALSFPAWRRAAGDKKLPFEDEEEEKGDDEEEECAVCLRPLGAGPFGVLDCSHGAQFHAHCLEKWLHTNLTCPLCRAASPTRPRPARGGGSPAEARTRAPL